jgi:proteasome accessory factor C
MTRATTAGTRLERILHMLPLAAREQGVSYDHLAQALDCSRADIVRDLNDIADREFYKPRGASDPIQILLESDRVRLWTSGEFRRPVRLSPKETLALGLGLRALAADAAAAGRHRLLELASRLEAQLAAPIMQEPVSGVAAADARRQLVREGQAELQPTARPPASIAFEQEFSGDDLLPAVADAIRARRCLDLRYVKPGDASPEVRHIAPYRLVHSEGAWYLLALDNDRGAIRAFRLDRMLSATMVDETFDVPADFDPRAHVTPEGKLFRSTADEEHAAWVRYSPRIARWIVERTGMVAAEDGSITIPHRVADARWLVRHVLQYGADAEVVAPAELRARTRQVAERLAETP